MDMFGPTLFVFAHLDDETILSFGTMKQLRAKGHRVGVLVPCGFGRPTNERPDSSSRRETFNEIMDKIGVDFVSIGKLHDRSIDVPSFKEALDNAINMFIPTTIVTHSPTDIHTDHSLVAYEVLVASRPHGARNTRVQQVLTTVSPNSLQGFGQFGKFNPDTFVNITEYCEEKNRMLMEYTKTGEGPYDYDDARSASSISAQNLAWGRLGGCDSAEAYETVFRLC